MDEDAAQQPVPDGSARAGGRHADAAAATRGGAEGGGNATEACAAGRGYASAPTQAYLRKLERNLRQLEDSLGPSHPQVRAPASRRGCLPPSLVAHPTQLPEPQGYIPLVARLLRAAVVSEGLVGVGFKTFRV